jgi:DNA replication protein DnaC
MTDIDEKDRLILQYCSELRLGQGISANYKNIEAQTHQDFLLELLKIEVENRTAQRKTRNIKTAGFHTIKTFENFTFEGVKIPSSITMDEITTLSFIAMHENLICYGSTGTGKTHLAIAIGVQACLEEKVVKFYRTASLVNELSEAKNHGEQKSFLSNSKETIY